MVFSPAPLYLDPHNWDHHQQQAQIHQHQQQSQQLNTTLTHGVGADGGIERADNSHHQITDHMQQPIPSQAVGGGTSSSIRPGSMADRARQAKIPQPEPGLKCPRCASTNTKFCYFNNYSLTQPRHFCKMCRRYWTKGGALRTVPVGGGCRKNNKSNKGREVSKAVGELQGGAGPNHNNSTSPISSNSNNTAMNNRITHDNMLDNTSLAGHSSFQPRITQFPLLASLQGLNHSQYVSPTSNNLGVNFGGMMNMAAQAELGFHIGASASNVNSDHQWRPNHFPSNFLATFDPAQFSNRPPSSSSCLYHFPIDHQSLDQHPSNPIPPRSSPFITSINQHLVRSSSMPLNNSTDLKHDDAAAVKNEEEAAASQGGMNSQSRPYLGMSDNNQYWTANKSTNTTWRDLSGVNSSTTRHL